MNSTYWPFMKRMADIFNYTGNVTLAAMPSLEEIVEINWHLNRPLPTELTEADIANLKHLSSFYKQFTWKYDLAKAANKYKFKEIIKIFDNRINNEDTPLKWTFLSDHGENIAPLYNDLNFSSS